jgi:hypothetical protein
VLVVQLAVVLVQLADKHTRGSQKRSRDGFQFCSDLVAPRCSLDVLKRRAVPKTLLKRGKVSIGCSQGERSVERIPALMSSMAAMIPECPSPRSSVRCASSVPTSTRSTSWSSASIRKSTPWTSSSIADSMRLVSSSPRVYVSSAVASRTSGSMSLRDPLMGRDDRAGTRPRDAGQVPFGVRLSGQPAGMPGMAAASGTCEDTLAWTSQWYLCQDTLREANARLVNAHYQHRHAQLRGGGTLSSWGRAALFAARSQPLRPGAVALFPRRRHHHLHPRLRPAEEALVIATNDGRR